jgi:hypothetical protein
MIGSGDQICFTQLNAAHRLGMTVMPLNLRMNPVSKLPYRRTRSHQNTVTKYASLPSSTRPIMSQSSPMITKQQQQQQQHLLSTGEIVNIPYWIGRNHV